MEYSGKICVIDIETDGLDPTVIHCAAAKSVDGTVQEFLYHDDFRDYVSEFDYVVAHNGCSYDFPVLRKLWHIYIPLSKQVDTVILSRLSKPDREGGHSLKAWGEKLLFQKGI